MNIAQSVAQRLIENVSRVIIGKQNEVRLIVIGFLCQGHILLEDVPGVGKTVMAKACRAHLVGVGRRPPLHLDAL
jgi:MoxR-like ATPase